MHSCARLLYLTYSNGLRLVVTVPYHHVKLVCPFKAYPLSQYSYISTASLLAYLSNIHITLLTRLKLCEDHLFVDWHFSLAPNAVECCVGS